MATSRKAVRRRSGARRVSVKKKKKTGLGTKARSQKPNANKLELLEKIGKDKPAAEWDTAKTTRINYKDNKLTEDVNMMEVDGALEKGDGRSKKKPERDLPMELVDEVRATFGKQRMSGKRPPKKLTTVQIAVVEKLIEKHGNDGVEAMSKDIKLNRMQHSPGVLRKMIESYHAYPSLQGGGEGRRDFHSIQK